MHQNGEQCSQCQGLKDFLGRGRHGFAFPLQFPEIGFRRKPGCAVTWQTARLERFNNPKQGAVVRPVSSEGGHTLDHHSEPASDSGMTLGRDGWQSHYPAQRGAQGSSVPLSLDSNAAEVRAGSHCLLPTPSSTGGREDPRALPSRGSARARARRACALRLRSSAPCPPLSFAPPCYPLPCR